MARSMQEEVMDHDSLLRLGADKISLQDSSSSETKSMFANITTLPTPYSLHATNSTETLSTKLEETLKTADSTLICKKASPRKDARRQIHLKPISKAHEDLSLTITAPRFFDDTTARPRRRLNSPSKTALLELTTAGTSLGSLSSEADNASEFSMPTSNSSDDSIFDIGARIPQKLISHTSRQLFSPSKPRARDFLDDSIADTTTFEPKLQDSMCDLYMNSLPVVEEGLLQPTHELRAPILAPSTWCSDDAPQPCTPPQSPSKSKLISPSKTRIIIPTPPEKSSADAFWSVEKVNSWNEQHSPQKIVRSPKKSRTRMNDSTSPISSPRKSPVKNKAEITEKKDFDARKKDIAKSFLLELDETITEGQIQSLSAATGGVDIIWSKTLNTTAGRANWRKETSKRHDSTGGLVVQEKHFASIEIAEKVIDDEARLLNVLAHEFCHLANFMVTKLKERPHGPEFKAWGRKCTLAFGDRGVKVTTKHDYEIDYKYIWSCTNDDCQQEFKRHSKSIDPTRQRCGACQSQLIQIKPVPRRAAADGVKSNTYTAFVKEHFATIKQSMPGASQKDIMLKIGEKYRAAKEEVAVQATSIDQPTAALDMDSMADALGAIVLDQ